MDKKQLIQHLNENYKSNLSISAMLNLLYSKQ
jgi:hypothetical protein